MSVPSKVLPKAIIAALVGAMAGATAGVWSLRQPAPSASVTASPATAPRVTTRMTDSGAGSPSTSLPKQAVSADDDTGLLQRARTLARRPDVTALIALRDDVVRRATEHGTAGSSSIKGQLDEIDIRLNEARLLQLKLDAEELRKVEPKAAR